MEKSITRQVQYSDPDIESTIAGLNQDLESISIMARQDGDKNKPVAIDFWKGRTFNVIEAKTQVALDTVRQKLQPMAGMMVANKVKQEAEEQIQQIQVKKDDQEIKLNALKPQEVQSNTPQFTREKNTVRNLVIMFIVIAGGVDGYQTWEALRAGHLPSLSALLFGIAIAGVLTLGAHLAADYYMKEKDERKKKIGLGTIILISVALFLMLGFARASFYNDSVDVGINTVDVGSESNGKVSGLLLAGISEILFLAALFFSVRTWRSDEITPEDQKNLKLNQEIEDLKADIAAKENQITAIQENAAKEADLALHKWEYAVGVEEHLVSLARYNLALYAQNNLAHRKDNQAPIFLAQPPQFNFKLFFIPRSNGSTE